MKIKYLHVLGYDDVKFYPSFVKMINESGEFNKNDFLFVTPFKKVYNALSEYSNVKLMNKHNIKKLMFCSNWIFFHPLNLNKLEVICLPKKIANKIIWRTWGHDIRPLECEDKNILKRNLKKIIYYLYKRKVNQFKAIAVGNDIDRINVKNVFGNKINTSFKFSYLYNHDNLDKLDKIKNNNVLKKDDCIRIMIGHNAGKAENHLQNLQRVAKYANENIKVILPLSYSKENNVYIKQIKDLALQLFSSQKVEFIEYFMDYFDYAKLINQIDICILDQEFSNGLGNLSLLIYFNKKIYINRFGNIAQCFKENNIICNYSDDIGNISFQEFKRNNFDNKMLKYSLSDYKSKLNNFKEIIKLLDSNK